MNTMWVKHPANPVFDVGPPGAWDAQAVVSPSVVYDPAAGLYRMWYSGMDVPWTRETQAGSWRVGLAVSSDGVHWERHPDNPVLDLGPPGSWDDAYMGFQEVHYEDGQYRMYYAGSNQALRWGIGLASSADGVNWTKHPSNPVLTPTSETGGWEAHGVCCPAVLRQGDRYLMWYMGNNVCRFRGGDPFRPDPRATWVVGLATSADGVTWTRHPDSPVLGLGPPGAWDAGWLDGPTVISTSDGFAMWYSGWDEGHTHWRLGRATSPDGVRWEKDPRNPVLPLGSEGSWEDRNHFHNFVMVQDGTLLTWYSGNGDRWRIGLATGLLPTGGHP